MSGDALPVERRKRPTVWRQPGEQDQDAQQRDRKPEGREHQILPAGLQCVAPSAVGDQQRRGARRRLDQQPRDPEILHQSERQQRSPEQVKGGVVPGARPTRGEQALTRTRQVGRRDHRAAPPDHRNHREKARAGAVQDKPGAVQPLRTMNDAEHARRERHHGADARADQVHAIGAARRARQPHEQRPSQRHGRHGDQEQVSHAAPPAESCRHYRAARGSSPRKPPRPTRSPPDRTRVRAR